MSEEVVVPDLNDLDDDFVEQPEEPQMSEEETIAREKGWVPQEEWQGDAYSWVDAGEFLRRGPLFDTIHNLKREVKQLTEGLNYTHSHYQDLMKKERDSLMRELKAQRKEAFEEQDFEKLEAVEEDMEKLKAESTQPATASQANQPPPEFLEWSSKNPWYQTNPALYEEANGIAQRMAAANPNLEYSKLLNEVGKAVKENHPEIFQKTVVPKTTQSSTSTKPAKGRGFTLADLPADERRVAKTLIRSGAITEEKFLKEYTTRFGS